MLTINGKHYGRKGSDDMVDSLFNPVDGHTLHGEYKATKRQIKLYKPNGSLFAAVVNNGHGEQFIVSASIQGGKPRYMFSMSSLDEKYMGIDGLGFLDTIDCAKDAINQVCR